jgi:diguanylate cyclase (GGDEF)-like protein
MFVHLERELARAERLETQVALIVMDVDGFKAINDTHGHHAGDHALRRVAEALQAALRPYDLCVRYAGDEFIIVLADCSRESADAKRVELQKAVEEVELEVRAGRTIRLGASAGVSVFPDDGATYEVLLAQADQRMYRDKAARRRAAAPDPARAPEAREHEPAGTLTAASPTPPLKIAGAGL